MTVSIVTESSQQILLEIIFRTLFGIFLVILLHIPFYCTESSQWELHTKILQSVFWQVECRLEIYACLTPGIMVFMIMFTTICLPTNLSQLLTVKMDNYI